MSEQQSDKLFQFIETDHRLVVQAGETSHAGQTWMASQTPLLGETLDQEFTTVEDVATVARFFAAFPSNALTGLCLVVSHGWYME